MVNVSNTFSQTSCSTIQISRNVSESGEKLKNRSMIIQFVMTQLVPNADIRKKVPHHQLVQHVRHCVTHRRSTFSFQSNILQIDMNDSVSSINLVITRNLGAFIASSFGSITK